MTRYFQSAPKHIRGIDMMRHSATVQPNLDIFENEDWHSAVHLVVANGAHNKLYVRQFTLFSK